MGSVNPKGFIQITDRTKDVIKSGGERISSVALENTLMATPRAHGCYLNAESTPPCHVQNGGSRSLHPPGVPRGGWVVLQSGGVASLHPRSSLPAPPVLRKGRYQASHGGIGPEEAETEARPNGR